VFQSTPPHGGRPSSSRTPISGTRFQSTPPHGGRPSSSRTPISGTRFQSTPPHGGRPSTDKAPVIEWMFQSTPPHGGRRWYRRCIHCGYYVSIHAPAWGATFHCRTTVVENMCFNPRPRMGGDPLAGQF